MKKIKVLLLAITITVAVICLLISTDWIQNYIASKATKYLSDSLSCTVKLENLKFNFPFAIKIKYLDISKEGQGWIRAKNISIKANILSLLKKKVSLKQVSAEQIILAHLPEFISTKNNDNDDSNNPSFLTKISIKNILVKQFIIKSEVTNLPTDIIFDLDSNLRYSSNILQIYLQSNVNQGFNRFTQEANISSKIELNIQDKVLNIQQMKIDSPLYDFNANGVINLNSEELFVEYQTNCPNLNLIAPEIDGYLGIEGRITGDLKNIYLTSTFITKDARYITTQLPDILLNSRAHYDVVEQVGKIAIDEENESIAAEINFKKDLDTIEISSLKIKKDSAVLDGKLEIDLNSQLLDGKLKLAISDFKDLSYNSDIISKGSGEFLLDLKSKGDGQYIEAELKLSNIYFGDLGIISIKSKLISQNIWKQELETFKLDIEDIHYKQELLNRQTNIQILPNNDNFKITLKSQGKPYNNFDTQILGSIRKDIEKKLTMTIDSLKTSFNKHTIVINKPASLVIIDDNFQYILPELLIDNGVLTSDGSLLGKMINIKAKLKRLPLYIRELQLPIGFMHAYADSELKIDGSLTDPAINARLELNNLSLPSSSNQNINLNMKYLKKRIDFSLDTQENRPMNGNFKLSIPVEISLLPYKFEINEEEKIFGNFNIKSQIDTLTSFFLSPIHRLKGELNVSAKVTGSIKLPYINGIANITQGKYENVQLGIKIKNINSIIEAQGRKILLKELNAYEDKKKTFTSTGYFSLDNKNHSFNFDVKANNFYFLNHPNVQSGIDADIKINGDNKNINVSGNIQPKSLEIRLPEQFEKEIYELNVTKVITNKGEKSIINNEDIFNIYPINLDVKILANNRVFIKGWGLDAELGGKLKCEGTAQNPMIRGNLESIHGRYQEFGKQFTIKEGSLSFMGSVPPSPFLNIVASSVQDNVEVMILISGPLLNPKLSIESNPPLPQDETLSILLFGKQSSQITPFQAIQLADSVRRFSGHGSSTNILDKARGILKIDEIRLKNSSSNTNDTALGIGKYITDKIFIEVEKGVQEGSGKTRIEVEVKNHLTLESSIGESGGSVGASWKLDY